MTAIICRPVGATRHCLVMRPAEKSACVTPDPRPDDAECAVVDTFPDRCRLLLALRRAPAFSYADSCPSRSTASSWRSGLRGKQVRLLLAYLLLNRTRHVGREELIGALWPDRAPVSQDAALRTLLSRLRSALGADRAGRAATS